MSPSYEAGSSSTPGPQRPHHQHNLSQNYPRHGPTSTPHTPADDPSANANRQRIRTEPTLRHPHISSTWLGPYNDQVAAPLAGSRSPRGAHRPMGLPHSSLHHPQHSHQASSGTADRIHNNLQEPHRSTGAPSISPSSSSSSSSSWQLDINNIRSNNVSTPGGIGTGPAAASAPSVPSVPSAASAASAAGAAHDRNIDDRLDSSKRREYEQKHTGNHAYYADAGGANIVHSTGSGSGSSNSIPSGPGAGPGEGPGLPAAGPAADPAASMFAGPLLEPSSSLQSLVESIDDDHVLKLTELTKRMVEQTNPTQKRQRVVSFPTSERDALLPSFHHSEKTLQFSNSVKASLEAKYSALFSSIREGRPINRLARLKEVLPRLKSFSVPRPFVPPTEHIKESGKTSLDISLPRPRRNKGDKHRFVDKVEESNCIWDLDHMEAKAAAEEATEAASLLREQQRIAEAMAPRTPPPHTHPSYPDSPLGAVLDAQNIPVGMSPSSTFSSVATNAANSQSLRSNSQTSLDRVGTLSMTQPLQKEISTASTTYSNASSTGTGPESTPIESSPSKRQSFLGIFGVKGKKGATQENDAYQQHPVQPFPQYGTEVSSPRVSAIGSPLLGGVTGSLAVDRFSLDSPRPPPALTSAPFTPSVEVVPPSANGSPSVKNFLGGVPDSQGRRRTSLEENRRPKEDPYQQQQQQPLQQLRHPYLDGTSYALTDDERNYIGPAMMFSQGERPDDSQDESDTAAVLAAAANSHKRSSFRRFTEKFSRRGPGSGHKALSNLYNISPTGTAIQGKFPVGRKLDPTTAMLQGQGVARLTVSQPSSGRNSLDGLIRPKPIFNPLSGHSSPTVEPSKSPDGLVFGVAGLGAEGGNSHGSIHTNTPWVQSIGDRSPSLTPVGGLGQDESGALMHLNGLEPGLALSLQPDHIRQALQQIPSSSAITTMTSATTTTVAPEKLMVDVERLPKRMLSRLKNRPELASVDWSLDTVDLSAIWTSSEPLPTYDEYIGLTDEVKLSCIYPAHLGHLDVIDLHLTLGLRENHLGNEGKGGRVESRGGGSGGGSGMDDDLDLDHDLEHDLDRIRERERAVKWETLEMKAESQLEQSALWLKEISTWKQHWTDAIERHRRIENNSEGDGSILGSNNWGLENGGVIVEEPEEEDEEEGEEDEDEKSKGEEETGGSGVTEEDDDEDDAAADNVVDENTNDLFTRDRLRPTATTTPATMPLAMKRKKSHIAPLETIRARKQQRERELSLMMSREQMRGTRTSSISQQGSLMLYTFKTSIEATKDGVKEMRVHLDECRERLEALEEARGVYLEVKEPDFKRTVDKFTMEWNESYFVKLKEVEDQIQIMNQKRIENPWMDMLLIMLSWLIRGLFYLVEGVTIMVIMVRRFKSSYRVRSEYMLSDNLVHVKHLAR
ncbi:hypothetical protein BGW38_002711 [Lunasporangiospora selenospora]|uniref:Uncharacterized protein n=1 Tax=Lunasporangiospora selenospora TaxID=979761 RepID=A0A9P6FTR5_9FUNG|nr:hypothetical protein BGW38_002711 [Lunasporangiospora selenospora]